MNGLSVSSACGLRRKAKRSFAGRRWGPPVSLLLCCFASPASAEILPSTPAACPVVIDSARLKVMPARRLLDGLTVGACLPDERRAQPLVWEACPWLPVPGQGQVIEQARLVYPSGGGAIEAVPCAPRAGGRKRPLTETVSGCPLRHDWQNGESYQRTRLVYDVGKGPLAATPCLKRDDRALVHRRQACVPLSIQLPRAGLVRIAAERIDGVALGYSVVIRDCQPVEGTTVATAMGPATIAADAEVCRGTAIDGAGESYLTRRYLLVWPAKAAPEAATNCLADVSRVYRHAIEDAGWRHEEARRGSVGLQQAVVRIGEVERRVGRPEARPGIVPWRQEKLEAVETGTSEKLGCTVLRHARYLATYARPDGTTLLTWLGPAESVIDARGCR